MLLTFLACFLGSTCCKTSQVFLIQKHLRKGIRSNAFLWTSFIHRLDSAYYSDIIDLEDLHIFFEKFHQSQSNLLSKCSPCICFEEVSTCNIQSYLWQRRQTSKLLLGWNLIDVDFFEFQKISFAEKTHFRIVFWIFVFTWQILSNWV